MFKLFKKRSYKTPYDDSQFIGKTTMLPFDPAFLDLVNGNKKNLSEEDRAFYCKSGIKVDNRRITLRKLCTALGIEVPARFEAIADERCRVGFRAKKLSKGTVYLIIRSAEDFNNGRCSRYDYDKALKRGAKVIIMARADFEKFGLKEEKCPVILMDDRQNERILRLYYLLHKKQKARTVMLTGSVGKTTTKDLSAMVARKYFKTFSSDRNANTVQYVAQHLYYHTKRKNEVYIQEAGAGYIGSVRFAAAMMQPEIFILTNVYDHHLQAYGSYERLFNDKTCPDEYMPENGVIITNFDDEHIRNHTFKHKVISFSIDYEDADYRAVNIRQTKDLLEFDIYEKATGTSVPTAVHLLGAHNAYNVLAVYILGKQLNLTDEQINAAMLEYYPSGLRQNLSNVAGIHFNIDCFNVAEASILAMLKAGETFDLEEGKKRIALIGGENKIGDNVSERSYEFGKKLKDIKVDQILFCGPKKNSIKALNHYGDGASIQRGFNEVSDIPNELALSNDEIQEYLQKNVKSGDLVMIKGIYALDMSISVDKAFGTSFTPDLSHYKEISKEYHVKNYNFTVIEGFDEANILSAPIQNGKLVIPDRLKKFPIFRICPKAFSGNNEIREIEFGSTLKNIGSNAFAGCTKLKRVVIPANVKVIEDGAFCECTSLEEVVLSEGITHLGFMAFSGCPKLKKVTIPSTVGMMKDAFDENVELD